MGKHASLRQESRPAAPGQVPFFESSICRLDTVARHNQIPVPLNMLPPLSWLNLSGARGRIHKGGLLVIINALPVQQVFALNEKENTYHAETRQINY